MQGASPSSPGGLGTIRDAVGKALLYLGDADPDVVVVTADVARSTRTAWFGERFPERFVNIGISEQDLVDFAAGLALAGKRPYAAAFAMFMMRAWEQIRNTVDRMRLDVKLVATHSGFSDHGDGASHQSLEDIALMRVLHNMTVVVPADPPQAYKALVRVHEQVRGPVYFRVGRDYSPLVTDPGAEYRLGRLEILRDGSDVALVSAGPLLAQVLEAARMLGERGVSAAVANLHTVKPLDEEGLERLARATGLVVVVEEHLPRGGLFGAVAEALAQRYPAPVYPVAARGYGHSARSVLDLYREHGLLAEQIARRVLELLAGREG
ncbi:transketolase [Pyrodictium occultum]|uniref:2-oxoacid oxidoreductase (ferredoxin) n=1 Tax=Pyrodictium occultum TaxID=2309 RepID=A0A0V8RWJ5_PYROC|nr:transketolase C-terminal domain-containing protein [Pyrodictium occultum]KSW12416.1 transketolase [Pyrodictium occultum]